MKLRTGGGATYGETGLGQGVNGAGHGGRRSKVIESSGGKALWVRSTRENTTKLDGGGLVIPRSRNTYLVAYSDFSIVFFDLFPVFIFVL